MRRQFWVSSALLVSILATLGGAALLARLGPPAALTGTPAAVASGQGAGITVEFLGWSHYRLTSPSGKVVLTNPYITNNPDAAITQAEAIAHGADLIVVADGHGDEVGDSVEIALGTGATIVTPATELRSWFAERGVPQSQLAAGNQGSTVSYEGIKVRILNSVHGSRPAPADRFMYAGLAGSYMITFENGYTVYFSGSSAATLDMRMWADLYRPDAAIVHISDNHEPLDAGMIAKLMANNNPNLKYVLPHHHRINPVPGGQFRPSELRTAMQQFGVNAEFIEPTALRPYSLSR